MFNKAQTMSDNLNPLLHKTDVTGSTGINVVSLFNGMGTLRQAFHNLGIKVTSSDLVDRGYGTQKSFFDYKEWNGDILTNPPYGDALKFCRHALDCVDDGSKVIMLMRIQFLEGKKRKPFLQATPPKYVYVSSSRLRLAKGGDFEKYDKPSANCYAWYVWEKGWKGETVVRWFN